MAENLRELPGWEVAVRYAIGEVVSGVGGGVVAGTVEMVVHWPNLLLEQEDGDLKDNIAAEQQTAKTTHDPQTLQELKERIASQQATLTAHAPKEAVAKDERQTYGISGGILGLAVGAAAIAVLWRRRQARLRQKSIAAGQDAT